MHLYYIKVLYCSLFKPMHLHRIKVLYSSLFLWIQDCSQSIHTANGIKCLTQDLFSCRRDRNTRKALEECHSLFYFGYFRHFSDYFWQANLILSFSDYFWQANLILSFSRVPSHDEWMSGSAEGKLVIDFSLSSSFPGHSYRCAARGSSWLY